MKALVIFSGGLDSTVCMHFALRHFTEVKALTFDYGQNHTVELEQSKKICQLLNIEQQIVDISFMGKLVQSALIGNGTSPNAELPTTYVPNRNQLFITIAHAYAQQLKYDAIVIGACNAGGSLYPDCSPKFIYAIQGASNLGSNAGIKIEAPLLYFKKDAIFALAKKFECLDFVLEHSHTCYNGNRTLRHSWGYGCGECKACIDRMNGYKEYLQ